MTTNFRRSIIPGIFFLGVIGLMIFFVTQEHNIIDIAYLGVLVYYFLRFVILRFHS